MMTSLLFCFLILISNFRVCFSDYIEDLKFGTPKKRIKAIEEISKKGESKYIDLLIEHWQDPDARVRISMAQTFRRNVLEPDKFMDDLGFRCVKDD